MIDIPSLFVGFVIAVSLMYVLYELMKDYTTLKQFEIDPGIANGIVGETAYCPQCGSTDLKLVDLYDQVPWLKGHAAEIDYYKCLKCGRVISDEEWKDAKKY